MLEEFVRKKYFYTIDFGFFMIATISIMKPAIIKSGAMVMRVVL